MDFDSKRMNNDEEGRLLVSQETTGSIANENGSVKAISEENSTKKPAAD